MRLGQLARKYNLTQQKIIAFLEDHNPGMGPYNQNTKLSDQTEELIASHFNKSFADADFLDQGTETTDADLTPSESNLNETVAKEPVKEEDNKNDEVEIQAKLDPTLPVPETKEPAPEEEPKKAISTDKLIELLDSEEADVDLSDITLIKAPKKELEGLKVVGKIDLPEPKPKTEIKEEKEESSDSSKSPGRKPRRKRQQLSPEEKEKRRLKAKKKKEAYEARQERRRREEAARRQKERKKAHYEEKIKQTKPSAKKAKSTKPPVEAVDEPKQQKPRPKTSFGRFWAWFWRGQKFDD